VSAAPFDVADTFVVKVDAKPEDVREAASRVAHRSAAELAQRLEVVWDVRARPGGAGGTFLSATARCVASSEETRARLLGQWGVVGPFVAGLAWRKLAAVKAYAEERSMEERQEELARRPALVAA
jgi:hypothetical protein